MIPFPGESAPLDWANVTAGAPFSDDGDAIRFRAGSATVVAGDVFVAGFYDHNYLEAGADAVFSAVVETLAGSSGTLALSGGPDVDWALEDANASTYDLGDHAVTGASTIVVPLPWVTVADYLAEDVETAVRVECTAGSVIVQQVKLRIWPSAGVAGGWSAEPFVQASQEKNPDVSTHAGGIIDAFSTSQAAFRADLATVTTSTVGIAAPGIATGSFVAYGTDVGGGIGAGYVSRSPGNLTGPGFEEDTWIVPPNEVPDDDDRVIFQPVGDDTFAWLQPVATLAMEPLTFVDDVGHVADGYLHVDAVEVAERVASGVTFASFAVGSTLATATQATTGVEYQDVVLPEIADPLMLRVTVWHDGHFGDVAATGGTSGRLTYGQTTDEVTWDRLLFEWTPAPYRYWNPAAVVLRKVRQFHRDDGLGVTPPRAFGGASRIRTGRAYGYD